MDYTERLFTVVSNHCGEWKEPFKVLSKYHILRLLKLSMPDNYEDLKETVIECFKKSNISGFRKTDTGWKPLFFDRTSFKLP